MNGKHASIALGLLSASIALGLAPRAQATSSGATSPPADHSANTRTSSRAVPHHTSMRQHDPNAQADQTTGSQANAKAQADQSTNTQANPKAQANTTTLPTIVVTATRRSESTQDVAGGVTALSGAFLDKIHANSFEEFAAFVPGLSYDSLGPTSDIVAIRGVTTGGTQLSSGIAMYLDQVPIGSSTPFGVGFQTIPINTFDLVRVEVLKGPQGTLYGANALGGAIKYVPVPPNLDDFGALTAATLSSTAHAGTNYSVAAMLNVPLSPGTVALRVDAVDHYETGFGHNTLLGIDNRGSARTTMGRVQLLTQFTPDLSAKLSAFSQDIDGNGLNVDFRNIATSQPIHGAYNQRFALPQRESNSLRMFSGIVSWNLHWAKFTSITAYQTNTGTSYTDLSALYNVVFHNFYGFPLSIYGFRVDATTKKTTQEFRLESPQGQHFEWLVGGYYAHEKTRNLVNLQNKGGSSTQGMLFGASPFFGVLPSTYRETSVFADGTWHATDRFDVMVGLRYSRNSQRYEQFAHGWLVVPAQPTLTTHESATSDQSVMTWLFSPSYHITDNVMVYAKVASGYRPGGPNFVLQLGNGNATFKPDKLWNYEIGEKATFLDGRARLNADAYDIEWSNIQLTVNNGGVNQIENAGSARIRGAELSAAFKATPHFTVIASGAYTDAKLTSAVPALGLTQPGSRLPFSARFNAALAATYEFNLGEQSTGQLTLSDTWVGDRTAGYKGSPVAPYYRLPGYNTTNLDLAIFAPHGIEVDAFVHNVFDEVGQVSATTITNQYNPFAPVPVVLSRPRTIGVRVSVAFGNPY